MLAPRYTLRGLLIAVTIVAVLAWVAHLGLEGNAFAAGLAVGVGVLLVTLVVQAVVFGGLWFIALVTGRYRARSDDRSIQPLVLVAALLAGTTAHAQPPSSSWFVPSSTVVGHGMQLQVSTGPKAFPGHLLVRVELTPLAPMPADRELTVEVRSRSTNGGGRVLVQQHLVIPRASAKLSTGAGATVPWPGPAVLVLAVPVRPTDYSYELRLFDQGRELDKLRTDVVGYDSQFGGGYGVVRGPWMLNIYGNTEPAGITAEGLGELFLGATRAHYGNQGWTPPGLDKVQPLDTARSASFSELPARWLDYAGLDLICISQDDIEALRQVRPYAWRAILDWTSSGGNLVIYDVAELSAEHLAKLDGWLTAPDSAIGSENGVAAAPPSGWQIPSVGEPVFRQRVLLLLSDTGGDATSLEDAEGKDSRPAGILAPTPPTAEEISFRLRPQLRGTVIAWRERRPFQQKPSDWAWILNTLTPARWQGPARWNCTMGQDDDLFWAFLVPGTGQSPVLGFQVLITLFVIAVGPVTHFWLRRRKRLDWIVVITPLVAMIVTAGLFAFALEREGTALKARARSFTELDQSRGEQVTLSRLSYYAAWTTGGRMRFSDQTWVQMRGPVSGLPLHRGESRTRWHDGYQELTGAWLPTRVPTQLLTVRPQVTSRRLGVQLSADGAPPTVRNQLAAQVLQLWLTDEAGRTFTAGAPLALGQAAPLQPCPNPVSEISTLLAAANPKVPDDLANIPSWQLFGSRMWFNPGLTGIYGNGAGLLEESLDPDQLPSLAVKPHCYLAILRQPQDFEWGRDDAQVIDGFHVLLGHW